MGQGGGGFIHNEHLAVHGQGLGYLHHLLFRQGQISYPAPGVNVSRIQLRQLFLCIRIHFPEINEVSHLPGLMGHIYIFHDIHL